MNSYCFTLPSLLSLGIIEDDTQEYSVTSFPFDVTVPAILSIFQNMYEKNFPIEFTDVKKLPFQMEFCAVALSSPAENFEYMKFVLEFYHTFFKNPSLLGDERNQNYFMRKIIRQLSLPFQFKEAQFDSPYLDKFCNFLISVLADFHTFFLGQGKILEKETWKCLFHVCIGIANTLHKFDFSSFQNQKEVSYLRQLAFTIAISTIFYSGLHSKKQWNILIKFSINWSSSFDYLTAWSNFLINCFSKLLSDLYHFKADNKFFALGVFDENISTQEVSFLFHKILIIFNSKYVPCTLR